MHMLAATDLSIRARKALQRAGLLARESGAEVVHVVDDDRPAELVAIVKREADRILGENIEAMRELQGVRAHALVVEGAPFDGILRAAGSAGSGRVVMGVPPKQLLRGSSVLSLTRRHGCRPPDARAMATRCWKVRWRNSDATAPPSAAAAPSASPSPTAAKTYVELLAELEARRRAADDRLLRKMFQPRDPMNPAQAGSYLLPEERGEDDQRRSS